jgi:hypothetical protein
MKSNNTPNKTKLKVKPNTFIIFCIIALTCFFVIHITNFNLLNSFGHLRNNHDKESLMKTQTERLKNKIDNLQNSISEDKGMLLHHLKETNKLDICKLYI